MSYLFFLYYRHLVKKLKYYKNYPHIAVPTIQCVWKWPASIVNL